MFLPEGTVGSELLKEASFVEAAKAAAVLLGLAAAAGVRSDLDEERAQAHDEAEAERRAESDKWRPTIEAMTGKHASVDYANAVGALMAKQAFGAPLASAAISGLKGVGSAAMGIGRGLGITKGKLLGAGLLAGGGLAAAKATKGAVGYLESPEHVYKWGPGTQMKTDVSEYGYPVY